MKSSIFELIYNRLSNGGFNVYSIGQHEGFCNEPYVVIKEDGESVLGGASVSAAVVSVIIFYPIGKYSDVSRYINEIRQCIKGLFWLKSTGEATGIAVDHAVRAYTCTMFYEVYKRRR
ncbi:MAG: hypothetical protein FWE29_04910 [Defluviitaleaceae bacterium]|nr:hypothetical protein [Defluviitaleaceae bacterium]